MRTPAFLLLLTAVCWCIPASAQVPAPEAPQPISPLTLKPRKASAGMRANPVIVEKRASAPQVVTLLHRLNGLKMFRLLLRSSKAVGAIAGLDDAFRITNDVHTNVIAGLALDDGQIAAWLPEAEAEFGLPPTPFAPHAPLPSTVLPRVPGTSPRPATEPPGPVLAAEGESLFERPDVTVIARDGKRLIARYIGLDGVSGLSVLKLADKSLRGALDAKEENIAIGQNLRLLGPEPVVQPDPRVGRTVYVRTGETEGKIVDVTRAPSGGIARLRVRSTKLSPANIGGIAINDAGETVGIVDAVASNEATLLPSALVRSAARRVMERQSSVPRPWVGIRGEHLGAFPLEQLLRNGWQRQRALALTEERRGILLTSVAPGSPAARAALRPGDVILRVNKEEIRNADDFSWLLEEARSGSAVHFTVARPGKLAPEAVEITLSEAPDRAFGLGSAPGDVSDPETRATQMARERSPAGSLPNSLIAQGIETIALKKRVASRFGANGGFLVIYVQPSTAAARAGLRPGDVIEAVNGQPVSSIQSFVFSKIPGASYSFGIVRNKERFIVRVVKGKG